MLFEGEDGVMYVLTVEAMIDVANPDYVRDMEYELASSVDELRRNELS